VTPKPGMQGSLLTQSWLQAGRFLTRWRREPALLIGSVIFPICLLLVYKAVLGEQVHKVTGVDSIYGLVPMCAVLAALFGALGSAVGITMERQSGLLSRMWVLPVHRASALTGRLTAEAARALIGTVLITAVGMTMGLRFTHGWPAVLAYILIPSVVVVAFTALVMALAIRVNGRSIVTWLAAGTTSLVFVSSGTAPIGLFPDWLRPLVRVQPMSPPIEVMRALAHDGPLVWPLAMTLIWVVVLLAVFIPLAVRGYRVAAESSA
jgi:ABC-2 type transport system permease protein